ncbi:MAG: GNAT family N-acetyltransferase [Planctomycetes bacterium]|nr:GNAT family N-acetyltransferase [Planctomycetota bacterium]
MQISLDTCVIRSFQPEDAASLARYANNRRIWRNLRDSFPHPYSLDDAHQFIARIKDQALETVFAIEVDSQAVGSIGIRLKEDVERVTGEMGYWLGEPFWGRGLMTDVVRAFTEFALREFSLQRLEAGVYEWNPASARVLEKAGYRLEGTLRRSMIKDGQVIDRLIYACLAEDRPAGAAYTRSDRLSS